MKIIGFLIGSLFLIGCQSQQSDVKLSPVQAVPSINEFLGTAPVMIPPRPTLDSRQVQEGQVIYTAHCTSCHGANLEGEANWKEQNQDGTFRAPPHDVTGHTWHHPDEQLIQAIRLGGTRLPAEVGGTSQMPAFEQVLTDSEILAVLAFIKSHWSPEIQATQWELSIQSEAR